jgi:hypothetical protein
MRIRPIDLERDYPTIQSWYEGYGEEVPAPSYLSDIGFMIEDLCAGFILTTNSAMTFLEPLIGNPKADSGQRAAAVDSLVKNLLSVCKEIGKERVHVVTKNPAVIGRQEAFKFKKVADGFGVYIKELK